MPPRTNRPLKTDDLATPAVDPLPTDTGLVPATEAPPAPPAPDADTGDGPTDAHMDPPAPDAAPAAEDDRDVSDPGAAPAPRAADADTAGQSDRPDAVDPVVAEGVASYEDNQRLTQVRPLTIDLES